MKVSAKILEKANKLGGPQRVLPIQQNEDDPVAVVVSCLHTAIAFSTENCATQHKQHKLYV